ncbi:SCO family protein [Sphingomonas sp.]|uniref:SCO family protein n=1 Tax=Sphingomonas sp. TaxID=28214 RepID=UPI001EC17F34|nr:SCO family protein [Sphingomonas sp.]MBX3593646.1 SCO family protein [Sphingomonas sp.]
MNRFVPFALALSILLPGCGGGTPQPAQAQPPLAGAAIGGPFTLVDGDGRTVTDKSFAGRYRIMYFGYTFCPDVCPVDMQNIGAGMKLLEKSDPAIAAKIVPVFVTVDPARDTPAVVKQFATAFYPRAIGLTGTERQVADAAAAYRVYYKKQPAPAGSTGYLVDHMRAAYLMSPDNKPIALLPSDQSGEAVAAEIRKWVN